ncbi:hypothetical protein V500_01437, partial [Pseudogymnoascus sp. VKM F-4518 (FW-2643)]
MGRSSLDQTAHWEYVLSRDPAVTASRNAVAVPQAHKFRKSGRRCIQPGAGRATFDIVTSPFSSRRISRENSSLSSVISSGLPSLGTGEQKHIQFNEQVEQCIALEVVGDKDEELDSSSRKATSQAGLSVDSKTIAILPSTTLKNEEDILEPLETAVKHNLFLGDELEDHNAHMDWQSPNAVANSKDSMIVQERLQNLHTPGSSSSLNGNSLGIRDTPSDMFMPYEEDNDDVVSNSLFGKVANLTEAEGSGRRLKALMVALVVDISVEGRMPGEGGTVRRTYPGAMWGSGSKDHPDHRII